MIKHIYIYIYFEIAFSAVFDQIESMLAEDDDSWNHFSNMYRWAVDALDYCNVIAMEYFDSAKIGFTSAMDYRTVEFFFLGVRSPVCVSTDPYEPATAEVCKKQFLAVTDVFLVPWEFCCIMSATCAVVVALLLFARRAPHRKMVVCTIGVTERFVQNLHNFTSLKLSDEKRDISSPLANTLDATCGVPGEMQTILFYVLGGMSIRVPPTYGYFGQRTEAYKLMREFKCNMRATQFHRGSKSSAATSLSSGAPGAPPGFARMKIIWDRLRRFGHHGYQVYLSGPRTVLDSLVGEEKRPLDQTKESSMVMQGAEPMPDAGPPAGVVAGFVPNPLVTAPGPVLEPVTVHDPAGVSHSVESRTMPTKLPNGEVRKYDPRSETGKRFVRWSNALYEAITPARMDKQYLKLYGEKQLGEVGSGAFNATDMARFVKNAQLMKSAQDMPTRMSGGKRELIPKDGKDVRSVVDNTAEVFAIMNAAGKTLEAIMFDPTDGLFRDTCIKHRTRPQITKELQAGLSGQERLAWEIDQTRMEAHIRVPGTLKVIIKMLEKVMRHVRDRFSGQLAHIYDSRIRFDEKHGMRIKIKYIYIYIYIYTHVYISHMY